MMGMTTLGQLEHHGPERVFASVTSMACSEFASQLSQVEKASSRVLAKDKL
jgi:hypothetical protein